MLFLDFYTNCQSFYHELENTLYNPGMFIANVLLLYLYLLPIYFLKILSYIFLLTKGFSIFIKLFPLTKTLMIVSNIFVFNNVSKNHQIFAGSHSPTARNIISSSLRTTKATNPSLLSSLSPPPSPTLSPSSSSTRSHSPPMRTPTGRRMRPRAIM